MPIKIVCRSVLLGLVFAIALSSQTALAGDAEIDALRAEIARLSERLDKLEAARRSAGVREMPAPEQVVPTASAAIEVKGDVRYRYEAIDAEGAPERNRNRIRARVGVFGAVNDTVDAGIGLASGGDSPTSTNQTLDNGFSTKDFGLDLAYVSWGGAENTRITAGKMKNPLHRTGGNALLWDGDLNPEGVALNFDKQAVFLNLAAFYVEERSSSDDSFLFAVQTGLDTEMQGQMTLTTGVGYYVYTNTRGNSPFFSGAALGNTVDSNGNLVNDYRQLELFAELGARLGELPVSVFADWVQNTEADTFDTAWALGMKLGKTSGPGTWDVAWIYQDVQADSMIATFNNSDFGGGGTDVSGHLFKGNIGVARNWTAGFTYFLNESGSDAGVKRDYNRLQADLQFKF